MKRRNVKNHTLYDSLGLREGYFFDRETWGHDRLLGSARPRGGMALAQRNS